MVGDDDPVAGFEIADRLARLNDAACDFMPRIDAAFLPRARLAIPPHGVAAADAACGDLHQDLVLADSGHRPLLHLHVLVAEVQAELHRLRNGHPLLPFLLLFNS